MVSLEDWVFQNVESMIMHGDAIGRIVARDARFQPSQIEMVDPAVVTIKKRDDGLYDWYFDRQLVPADEVWHVAGRPRLGSPFGYGLIEFMAQTAGVSLAARKYEAQWFGDGAHPTLIYEPPTDPGPTGAQAIKEKLLAITRGNREPLVTAPGTKVSPFQANPTDSALLEAMRANAADVAHFFGVPPELVGGSSGDSMTYSNVEARVLDLLAFAVQYWMTKLEKALSRVLVPQPLYAKFNEAAISRTDLRTKVETLATEVKSGIRTPNEARKVLDLPSLPGGDDLSVPRAAAPAPVESVDEPAA
jgi:HK97 family phage portal protein